MQREVLSLPGPVVSLAGQGPYLAVAVHLGMPLPGNQNIGVSVFNVGSLRKRTIHPMPTFQPIPLAPKSTLSWFGFTDENNVSINVKKDQNCQINASIDKLNLLFEAQIFPYIASWFIVCPIRFSKQVRITSFSEWTSFVIELYFQIYFLFYFYFILALHHGQRRLHSHLEQEFWNNLDPGKIQITKMFRLH